MIKFKKIYKNINMLKINELTFSEIKPEWFSIIDNNKEVIDTILYEKENIGHLCLLKKNLESINKRIHPLISSFFDDWKVKKLLKDINLNEKIDINNWLNDIFDNTEKLEAYIKDVNDWKNDSETKDDKELYLKWFINLNLFSEKEKKNIELDEIISKINEIKNQFIKEYNDLINFINWEAEFNNKQIREIQTYNDLYSCFSSRNQKQKSKDNDIIIENVSKKISLVLSKMFYFNVIKKLYDENKTENISSIIYILIDSLGLYTDKTIYKNEIFKAYIDLPNISDKQIQNVLESYLFTNKLLKNETNENMLYKIFIEKSNLFLWENNIKFNNLFNFIIEQNLEKLESIDAFLKEHYKKFYTEDDLIFIFKNNLENSNIIYKQDNIEQKNISQVQDLIGNWLDISILQNNEIDINIFRELYKDFYYIDLDSKKNKKKSLTIEEVNDFMKDKNAYMKYKEYKILIENSENQIVYLLKWSEEYINISANLDITFDEFKNDLKKFEELNDFSNKKRKIDNILWEKDVWKNIKNYYILLEKFNKLKSKYKTKRKKENQTINEKLENIFKNNSKEEIDLVIYILEKVEISKENTFETLEENINIIIKYKELAQEVLDEGNKDLIYLKDIAKVLNKDKQEEFYKAEFNYLWIEDFLDISESDFKNNLDILLEIFKKLENSNLEFSWEDFQVLENNTKNIRNKLIIINYIIDIAKRYSLSYEENEKLFEGILSEENFDFENYKNKIDILKKNIYKYKVGNWNTEIQNFVLKFLKWDLEEKKFLEKLNNKEEIKIEWNNDFDREIFKVLEEENEEKANKICIKIDIFFNRFFDDFETNKAHSGNNIKMWKSSWGYTSAIRTIFKTLRKTEQETSLEYLERIKILNFHNHYSNTDRIEPKIFNIINYSENIDLWFFDALEKFWTNSILKIKLKHKAKDDKTNKDWTLSWVNDFYNEIFKKNIRFLNNENKI